LSSSDPHGVDGVADDSGGTFLALGPFGTMRVLTQPNAYVGIKQRIVASILTKQYYGLTNSISQIALVVDRKRKGQKRLIALLNCEMNKQRELALGSLGHGVSLAWTAGMALVSHGQRESEMPDDWRRQHLETQPHLRGVRFHLAKYRAYRPGWEHDHCVGCWAKFMEHGSDREPTETEGYTTGDDYLHGAEYEWVCRTCFSDFRDAMGWTET
jgi:hypothetical protein